MKPFITSLFLTLFSFTGIGQTISSKELLNRSVAFHDPDNWWNRVKIDLVITLQVPDKPLQLRHVEIDHIKGTFRLSNLKKGRLLEWGVSGKGFCDFKVDFAKPATQAQADSLGLRPEQALRWRNYYTYLYGLPMKLKDREAKIAPHIIETIFMEQQVMALRITYNKAAGDDIWYFYFNPSTYALVGCRFYPNENQNDGEYIVLEDIIVQRGLRIPRKRTRYSNATDKLLGTEYLRSMEIDRGW